MFYTIIRNVGSQGLDLRGLQDLVGLAELKF